MEGFILYFGKASALSAVFFLSYYLLLRKETFFMPNRWFLLAGIAASLTLPLLIFKKIIWVEPATQQFATMAGQTPIISQSPRALAIVQPGSEINWLYVLFLIYLTGMLFFLARFLRDFWSLSKILKNQEIQKNGNFKFVDTNKIQSPFSFFSYIVFNSS
ncbi:MAG TPA: peptidase M56, partial [Flavobacterium sp.]|nr:peptidase M56 [Flavobacterium sp.]